VFACSRVRDDLTATDDPFKFAMRKIAGVLREPEKARLVGKLKAAHDRSGPPE
jgi:hypothetical protein